MSNPEIEEKSGSERKHQKMPRRHGEPFKVKFHNISVDEVVLELPVSERR
jgi:hypothetical protein